MRPSTRAVASLLFASGFAALIYQTEWQRTFRLIFGASTGASAAVLGIFLGGLGLGGFLFGKRVEHSERPLFFYGNLEVLIALSAALTPVLADVAARVYFHLGGSRALGFFGATCLRLGLAALVIGPTTILMGGTLPAAARAVEQDDDVARSSSATLYAFNTAGAVLGALAGTFILFQWFGSQLTLWIACLINLLIAVIARALGRNAVLVERASAEEVLEADHPAQVSIYVTAAVLGFAFLQLEMVWYRMLGPILGGTTYTFGLILAMALLGIGAGAFAYSLRSKDRAATLSLLALTLGLEAFFVALPILVGDNIALIAAYTRRMTAIGTDGLLFGWVLVTSIVVLPAAVVSGYQFPLILGLLGHGKQRVARQVGLLYAFNTVGSISGAILTGFVLIPKMGAVATWRLSIALLVVLALGFVLAVLLKVRPFRGGLLSVAFVVSSAALVSFFVSGPTAVWRHTPIGADRVNISDYDWNKLREWINATKNQIVWEKDGIESSVALSNSTGYAFIVNGKPDGSVINDRATQVMMGLLPALLHPNPRSAFVIGLGTGMTAGWLGKVDSIERVDVAELEPVILNVARAASLANGAALDNPKVSIFPGDGREFMLTSHDQYDLIVSEPSNPYRAGIASLFTADFYGVVAAHLKADGLFGQWLQGYEVDAESVRVVLKTLRSAFPSVEAWFTMGGDFLLVASKTPRTYDLSLIASRLERAPYKDIVPRVWLTEGVAGVLSHFVVDAAGVEQMSELPGTQVSTDDLNYLEYAFARNVGRSGTDTVEDLLRVSMTVGHDRPPVVGNVDWGLVDELRNRGWMMYGTTAPVFPLQDADARSRAEVFGMGCLGTGFSGAAAQWQSQPQHEPRDIAEVFVLGQAFAQRGDDRALEFAKTLAARGFDAEAALVKARYFAQVRQADAEMTALLEALAALKREPLPLCATASQVLDLLTDVASSNPTLARQGALALMEPFAIDSTDALRGMTLERLAWLSDDPDLCVRAMGKELEVPRWTEDFLRGRLGCLERVHHPLTDRARADMLQFLESTSGSFNQNMTSSARP